jgi:ubiquinone/menaquinone biosynthesis C-methylase UbiE
MTLAMRTFRGKQVLALVRGGDYAHPGNEEPVNLMMRDIQPDKNRLILDVACGLGGTAKYVQEQNWGRVVGVDIEAEAIKYAKKTYPEVEFHVADVVKVHEVLQQKFDLIYICGSFLCFPNQPGALQSLRKVAKDNAKLILFDLVDRSNGTSPLINTKGNRVVNANSIQKMESMMENAGWKLLAYEDLSSKTANWYKNLLDKIRAKKQEIITKFGQYEYDSVLTRYTEWHKEIDEGRIGCGIYHAEAIITK